MAATPRFKIFNPEGEYVAACVHLEDAAALVALYGAGAQVRDGHAKKFTLWKEQTVAEEQTREKKHQDAVLRETPDVFRMSQPVIPKSAKYRPLHKGDKPGPDISVGMLVTVAVNKGSDRIGYLLFEILDWDDSDPGCWNYESRIYGRVRAVSHESLAHKVGRLSSAKRYRQFGGHNVVVDWTPDAFASTPSGKVVLGNG